jgi:hypothetical protein
VELEAALSWKLNEPAFKHRKTTGFKSAVGIDEYQHGPARRLDSAVAGHGNSRVSLSNDGQRIRTVPITNRFWGRFDAAIIDYNYFETRTSRLLRQPFQASGESEPIVIDRYNDAKERRALGWRLVCHDRRRLLKISDLGGLYWEDPIVFVH